MRSMRVLASLLHECFPVDRHSVRLWAMFLHPERYLLLLLPSTARITLGQMHLSPPAFCVDNRRTIFPYKQLNYAKHNGPFCMGAFCWEPTMRNISSSRSHHWPWAGRWSTQRQSFLEQLFQFFPTGECSRNARETASHCPPGEKDRKRLRSDCSSSKEEETKTSRKDLEDPIRAFEDEIQDLLASENGGSASAQTPHDNANAFKRVDCNLRDEEKKRRPINKQFAEMTDKRWSKKLDQEEVSNLLAKYDPPENCVEISAHALTQKSGYSLTLSKGKPTFGLQIYSKPSRSQVLPL